MRNPHQPRPPLERALSGLANSFAAIVAVMTIPYVALHFRAEILIYIATSFSWSYAYWGSWIVVCLIALAVHFTISSLLQLVIFAIFRRAIRPRGF
mgnify:FL=1